MIRVDLPAPLWPRSPTTSPGWRSTVTSSTALMPPKAMEMLRISTSGRCVGWRAAVHGLRSLTGSAGGRRRRARRPATSTAPTTMFCSGVSTPSSTMPDCRDCITSAPSIAPGDRADAAGERRAADHRGGDHVELVEGAGGVGGGVEARGRDAGRDAAEHAHQAEDLHQHPAGRDAGQLGRLRVAADGEDVAAEAQALGQEGHHERRPRWRSGPGTAMPCGITRPPSGQAMPLRLGEPARDADRERIGVGDRRRREHRAAGQRRDDAPPPRPGGPGSRSAGAGAGRSRAPPR